MIELRCDSCGHEARAPESFRGRKVRCPRCRTLLRAPAAGGPAVEPAGFSAQESATTERRRGEVLGLLRALLGDRPVRIAATATGFEVRLRDARAGEARALAQRILALPSVRDVRLLGGLGTALLEVAVEGARFDADESFAGGDAETQTFRREDVAAALAASPGAESPTFESEETEEPPEDGGHDATTETHAAVPEPAPVFVKPPGLPEETLAELMTLLAEGQEHLDRGEPRLAVAPLERAVRIDRTWPDVVRALGDAYARVGEHDRARKAFRHLSRLEPEDAQAFVQHAAMAVACERLDEALVALGRAMTLAPEDARVYRYAAVVHERKGDPEAARRMRSKHDALGKPESPARPARRREPEAGDALEGYPISPRLQSLAAPVLERGDPEACRKLIEQTLEDPCYAPLETLERVERALASDDLRRAAGELQRLAATWLASPRYHALRGEVARRRGREGEAEQERRFEAQCAAALAGTGDGSRERPFLVLHASDEHDVIERARPRGSPRGPEPAGEPLVASGKLLVERRQGRVLDVVTVAAERTLAFDVTGPHAVLVRHGEPELRPRPELDRGVRGPSETDGASLLPLLEDAPPEDGFLRSHARKVASLVAGYPLPREVKESFLELLASPQAPRFLDLRRSVLAGHFAALWSFDWAAVEDRLRRERFPEALELLEGSLGLGLLSAPYHRLLGRARRGLGQGQLAAIEQDLARRCGEWVELTGDGSEARPFVVSCAAEAEDLLAARKLDPGEPHLRRRRDRALWIHALEDGARLWFDVSDPFREVHLHGVQAAAAPGGDASAREGAQRLLWVRSWANARPGAAALESREEAPETVQLFEHEEARRQEAKGAPVKRPDGSPWLSAPHQPAELHRALLDLGPLRVDPVWTRHGNELADAIAPYHVGLDLLRDFLGLALPAPSRERYLEVRRKLLEGQAALVPAQDPRPLQELAHARRYEELAERLRSHMSTGLLSVHTHRLLSLALRETGREFLARTEYLLAHLARTWIQQTGDGTLERPWLVTCPRDGVELLEHMGIEAERRETVERGGRVLEVAVARGGRRICFSCTSP